MCSFSIWQSCCWMPVHADCGGDSAGEPEPGPVGSGYSSGKWSSSCRYWQTGPVAASASSWWCTQPRSRRLLHRHLETAAAGTSSVYHYVSAHPIGGSEALCFWIVCPSVSTCVLRLTHSWPVCRWLLVLSGLMRIITDQWQYLSSPEVFPQIFKILKRSFVLSVIQVWGKLHDVIQETALIICFIICWQSCSVAPDIVPGPEI